MPIVNGFDQEFAGRVALVRVNIHNKDSVALQQKYGFTATPEFFLVDASGRILGHWDEGVTMPRLEQSIDQLAAGPP